MGKQSDPLTDLLNSLGWLFLFAGFGAISAIGWLVYGFYALITFLI